MSALVIRPRCATNNHTDVRLFYSILFGKLTLIYATICVAATNFYDIFEREFCRSYSDAVDSAAGYWAAYMLPLVTRNYMVYRGFANVILLRQFRVRYAALRVQLANLQDLVFVENVPAMLLAFYISLAAFLHHILSIIFWRANKEVFGVTAKRRIASMAAKQAIWDRAMRQLISDAMGRKHFAVIGFEFSVTFDSRGLPQPTFVRAALVNMRPKAFREGNFKAFGMMTNYVSGLTTWLFSYLKGLTTTTLTQRGKMKFELRVTRGIIVHVNSPFTTLTTPQDGSTHRCGNFMRFLLDYFSTNERDLQSVGGAV